MIQIAPFVLIVDPDEQFSAVLAAEVQDQGLRTVCCRSWWEAKPLIENSPGPVLLIVDLVQPAGMPNGVSVALMARARRPKLPVLFVSEDPELLREVRAGTGVTLAKSVGVGRLARCARELAQGDKGRSSPHLFASPRVSLSPVAGYRLDHQVRFRSVSDSALVLWRKTRADLLGRPLLDVFPQLAGQPKFLAHLEALSEQRSYQGVVASLVLQQPIDIRIRPERAGLAVEFELAA